MHNGFVLMFMISFWISTRKIWFECRKRLLFAVIEAKAKAKDPLPTQFAIQSQANGWVRGLARGDQDRGR